jgi:hypothetical protein
LDRVIEEKKEAALYSAITLDRVIKKEEEEKDAIIAGVRCQARYRGRGRRGRGVEGKAIIGLVLRAIVWLIA